MIKSAIGLVASMGVTQVTKNVVKVTTPEDLGKTLKVITGIGSVVLGMIVSEKAVTYTGELYDDLEKDIKGKFKKKRSSKTEELLSE